MKTLFLIAFPTLFAISGYSQKCLEIIDPITNEKSIEFKYEYKMSGIVIPGYTLKYEVKNNSATLTKEFSYGQLMKVSAPIGTEVYFKLENGTVLKLKTVKEALPQVGASRMITTTYNFVFELTKAQLTSLAGSPLILIRLPKIVEEGYIDIDEKNDLIKNNKKPLMKGAECISTFL